MLRIRSIGNEFKKNALTETYVSLKNEEQIKGMQTLEIPEDQHKGAGLFYLKGQYIYEDSGQFKDYLCKVKNTVSYFSAV